MGGKFHIGIWKSFFGKTLELKLCTLCIMRFELVFFDLSFVWSLVSTTTSSILKRYRYESHATLQTLQRFFSTGKLVDAMKVQIYILSRKVVMMILPLCTRVVRQSPIFFCIHHTSLKLWKIWVALHIIIPFMFTDR